MKPISLCQLQSDTISELLSLKPQGKRSMSYNLSFLNKSPRSIIRIKRNYFNSLKNLGYRNNQFDIMWQDVKDVAYLEMFATNLN